MTIQEILIILENRIIALTESRKNAVSSGDLPMVIKIDTDLNNTLSSVDDIKRTLGLPIY
jgi:hypothetical protein